MDVNHAACDEQSLRLTEAALEELRRFPHLLHDVVNTLDHWDRVAPVDSKPLRDQWRRILACGAWAEALDPGQAGQELRQASPLGKALSQAQRMAIIRACKSRHWNT